MILSFGAELHLLEELLRIQAAVERTIELAAQNTSIFLPSQFRNEDNPRCHEATRPRPGPRYWSRREDGSTPS